MVMFKMAVVECKVLLYADDSALLVSEKDITDIGNTLTNSKEWITDYKAVWFIQCKEGMMSKNNTFKVCCNGAEIISQKSTTGLLITRLNDGKIT